MEQVDIIDSNNNIIGADTRENVHASGMLHRCVIAELKDNKGNWLFVKQSSGMQDAGRLASATGGHVVSGEKSEDALKREVNEELGIKKFSFKHRGNIIYHRKTLGRDENHFFIVYDITSDERIVLNEESDIIVSMTNDELKEKLINDRGSFGDALLYIIDKLYPELTTD